MYRYEEGLVLSNYGDAGWGRDVMDCKYKIGRFSKDLVQASYSLLKDYVKMINITWATSIPSLRRTNLVIDFARELAIELDLDYIDCIIKTTNSVEQKKLNNSINQFNNVDGSFEINNDIKSGNVLLIDDMVDSRWTFT